MNFRLTGLKIIISILIGLILGIYFSKEYYIGISGPPYKFGIYSILGFVIGLVVTYLIWSLIQKKK